MIDRTDMRFWFPRIGAAGLPVPRTVMVAMQQDAIEAIHAAFDGSEDGDMHPFLADLTAAGDMIGWPVFLRTAFTSAKHEWSRTCYVRDRAVLAKHVFAIAEFSELAGMIGLPWTHWAVREFLPTRQLGVCPQYGDMPVCREFRVFVDGGQIACWHPYWPADSLDQGGARPKLYEQLCRITEAERDAILALASRSGQACGGAWSVDIIDTERGWFVTDMAEAGKSFHWAGCPTAGATA